MWHKSVLKFAVECLVFQVSKIRLWLQLGDIKNSMGPSALCPYFQRLRLRKIWVVVERSYYHLSFVASWQNDRDIERLQDEIAEIRNLISRRSVSVHIIMHANNVFTTWRSKASIAVYVIMSNFNGDDIIGRAINFHYIILYETMRIAQNVTW